LQGSRDCSDEALISSRFDFAKATTPDLRN